MEVYDGHTDCKRWLTRFEQYATALSFTAAQQAAAFSVHCSGRAANWLDTLPDVTKTVLQALKQAFTAKFLKSDISQLKGISTVWTATQGAA